MTETLAGADFQFSHAKSASEHATAEAAFPNGPTAGRPPSHRAAYVLAHDAERVEQRLPSHRSRQSDDLPEAGCVIAALLSASQARCGPRRRTGRVEKAAKATRSVGLNLPLGGEIATILLSRS